MEYLLLIKQYAEEQVTTISKKRHIDSSQTRIDKFYESDKIDNAKQVLCNKAVAKFFICCGVAFHLVSHPFFIDMVKSLCNEYEPPCPNTLSNMFMNDELTEIIVDQQLTLDKESDLTLESHTTTFLAEKINEVITDIGPEKFSAIVSDYAAACASAKRIISDTHKHIIPI
ncbi:ribonuclease H-like domain-containing protein [Rhizophagus irregularis DAOM 181602=DAOM 197198]|nr:ribonuclease H-like domain-containing protein [Rhizophagus irregularis DAOM 181602=DAOM 197198]